MSFVHVIVMKSDMLDSIKTWAYAKDDKRGIAKAETEFKKEVLNRFPDTSHEDMADMLDDGYCEGMNFGIFITHSTLEEP